MTESTSKRICKRFNLIKVQEDSVSPKAWACFFGHRGIMVNVDTQKGQWSHVVCPNDPFYRGLKRKLRRR